MKNSLRAIFASSDKGRLQRELDAVERTRERFGSLAAEPVEDKLPSAKFSSRRVLTFSQRAQMEMTADDNIKTSIIFNVNELGLKGERVLWMSTGSTLRNELKIVFTTRTRTQRFLAWITRTK